jgi:hypothetical protein
MRTVAGPLPHEAGGNLVPKFTVMSKKLIFVLSGN